LVVGGLLLLVPAGFMIVFWHGGGSPSRPPSAASTTVPGTPGPVHPSGFTAPGSPGGPPRGTAGGSPGAGGAGAAADDAAGFLTELGAIDPALVTDRDGALRAGQSTCQDLRAGTPYDVVVRAAAARFKAPQPKAALIVDAARNHLCPG